VGKRKKCYYCKRADDTVTLRYPTAIWSDSWLSDGN